ncbi:mechanosensitive ion channel family protein [Halomarina pelagica]|uniref:mechanosensitive ion channel family protein n=1 Tax=Halomarina pelagica TaxID=2961599 RepID=UPI0020C3FFE2|nr:mechanosensitive ion channel family protein [Halomarina sp. BND7]
MVAQNGTNGSGGNESTILGGPSNGTNNTTGSKFAREIVELFPDWIPTDLAEPIGKFIAAIFILALAWYASKLINRLLGRRIARRFRRPSVSRTVLRLIRLIVMLFAFSIVLTIYGTRLGDIVLSVTVFTAVVGVILAPIVGSYISGLFVLADQPYEVGDMIEIPDVGGTGVRGFVEDVNLRYTKIFTLNNTFLTIPNGTIRDRDVVNYSAEDPRTRLSLDVTVTYEGDLDEARQLIEDAARGVDVVIDGGPDIRIGSARYPAAPTCYINQFADHGVLLTLRYWVKEPYKLLTVRSKVQTRVWERLADADVAIPYPHSHVVFDDTSGHLDVALDGTEADGGTGVDHGAGAGDVEEVGDGEETDRAKERASDGRTRLTGDSTGATDPDAGRNDRG